MRRLGVRGLFAALVAGALVFGLVAEAAEPTLNRFVSANLWVGQPATAQNVVPSSAGTTVPTNGLYLRRAFLQNRSASTTAVALIGFLRDGAWQAGQWTNATTTYTADTLDAQDADTNDFALETTTVNDGFLVSGIIKFGVISLDVTTAGSGTSPTHVFEYWNGSAWTAIAAVGMLVDVARSADWAAGEQIILFESPVDWAVGGSGTNVPAANYNVRVRRTNATQATAALARRVYVGKILLSEDGVVANGKAERTYDAPGLGVYGPDIVALGAAFGVADAGNLIELTVIQPRP